LCTKRSKVVSERQRLISRTAKVLARITGTVSVRVPTVFACRRINNLDHLYKMRLFNYQK
jgi:hypothetical protein